MNWYIAKVIFKITSTAEIHKSQFDEHLRLIQATSFEEALLKARILGITEEDQFINNKKQTIKWEFVNIVELLPLNKLEDGVEVYSQIHETDDKSYIQYVHQKAASLQLENHPAF